MQQHEYRNCHTDSNDGESSSHGNGDDDGNCNGNKLRFHGDPNRLPNDHNDNDSHPNDVERH